jgi:hypothetical protein
MSDDKINISHSKAQLYQECSQKYKYQYIDKIRPLTKNASLFFGSAIDLAVQVFLKDQTADWKGAFEKAWKVNFEWGKFTPIWDSMDVDYSYKDFDKDLLFKEDIDVAEKSKLELLPGFQGTWLEAMEHVTSRKKQRAHIQFGENELRYFNRLSWLSMNRKGYYMVKAFVDEIGPKIIKVLFVQKKVQITSEAGDVLTGYVDMVLELKDIGVVTLDLKTAAMPYDELEALVSQQLGIYSAILGPEINSYKVGFAVLLKSIKKDEKKICKVCGHKGEGKHKKCDAEIDGKRCNGEWDIQLEPKGQMQLITETLTETNIQAIMDTVSSITHLVKEKIFYRNPSACFNYGGCPYFEACWKGDFSKVKKDE